jgi:hypothetical protein
VLPGVEAHPSLSRQASIWSRPAKLSPFQRAEAIKRREAGENLTDIARTYGVAHTRISRLGFAVRYDNFPHAQPRRVTYG